MSLVLDLAAGKSQKIAVSTTSAQSAAINASTCSIYTDVDCYIRQGANPTALADGTDQFVPAGTFVRLTGLATGNKLAIIATASGTVHLTPGA